MPRRTTRTLPGGTKEWTIDSPIQFNYRVRECEDVLDPRSDVLIYGHLADAESLMRAKLRPLKRVVVVDDKARPPPTPLRPTCLDASCPLFSL